MNNGLRDLLFFARYVARKHVKAEWKARGITIYDWGPRDLRIAAEQYLCDHWQELKPKAEEYLAWSKRQDEAKRRVRKEIRKRTLALRRAQKVAEPQS
jgi:hypothetical protein